MARLNSHAGLIATRAQLNVAATSCADDPVFEAFYTGYDRSFILANEKEEKAGFAQCLELNHGEAGAELAARYGAFKEVVMVAYDGETAIGGANFIAYSLDPGPRVVLNLNYLYVLPEQRRRGYFARLAAAVAEVARMQLGAATDTQTLIFIEQNDPLKMSAEAYAEDTRHSQLDQIDRLQMWAKLSALVVDFPYVQPPLSEQQEADDTLVYSVLGAREQALDACLLHAHLQRFFGISVLKGRALSSSPAAAAQLEALSAACARGARVALLDPQHALQRLRQHGVESAKQTALDMRAFTQRVTSLTS